MVPSKLTPQKCFLDIVDKITHIEKPKDEIIQEFVEKIVDHYRIKKEGITTRKVETYYNVIIKFELPVLYNFDLSENETQSIAY